jgi:hypothetical protein
MTTEIIHSLDDDGEPVVTVSLTNTDKKAVLYQEDYNKLIEQGLDPRWKFLQNRVVLRGERKIAISRLIMKAGKGDIIKYLDWNPLNLKRTNLMVAKGAGKSTAKLSPHNRTYQLLKQKGELIHTETLPSYLKD